MWIVIKPLSHVIRSGVLLPPPTGGWVGVPSCTSPPFYILFDTLRKDDRAWMALKSTFEFNGSKTVTNNHTPTAGLVLLSGDSQY